MASVLRDDSVADGTDRDAEPLDFATPVPESLGDDDEPSPLDMEAVGTDVLETSSDDLVIEESAPSLPTNLAALAKDVWLDSEGRVVDAGSAKLCEELRLEIVWTREVSDFEKSDCVLLDSGAVPALGETGKL